MDTKSPPPARLPDLAPIACLVRLWIDHCEAAAIDALERPADPRHAHFGDPADAAREEAESWRQLGDNPVARTLFALGCDPGERALALSLGSSHRAATMIGMGLPQARDRVDSQAIRAGILCQWLNGVILFGSSSASRLFPDREPFRAGGAFVHSSKMRPRRIAHLASLFGSIPSLAIGVTLASPSMGAHAMPAMAALAAASAAVLVGSAAIASFGLAPEGYCAARIVKSAWPSLSDKSVRAMLAFGGHEPIDDRARSELARMDLGRASPSLFPDQEDGLAGLRQQSSHGSTGSLGQAAIQCCQIVASAFERQGLAEHVEPSDSAPRPRSRSL